MLADAIPYQTPGTIVSSSTITATGSSVIYFYGFSASDTDQIDLIDTTDGLSTGPVFTNNSTSPGSSVSLATSFGDNIVVEILNLSTGLDFYSGTGAAPIGFTASADGVNHGYVTTYSGGTIGTTAVPAGLFVGMEDLDARENSDWDYNDDEFVLTGVTNTAPTPEPGSLMLLGTGVLGLAGTLRRRILNTVR